MLLSLSIRNLAVVEAVDINFHRGFHVLTGETGAGKSIIIDALSLLAGSRGSADLIRYGCDKAEMEASFDLEPDHPIWTKLGDFGIHADPSELLIIRRDLTLQGKSISRINGQLVNLTMLREFGEGLINIHGQHEHQTLLRPERHLGLLDAYGAAVIDPIKRKYQETYSEFVKINQEYNDLNNISQKSLQMLDLYRFQLEEIAAAKLTAGEDALLAEERLKLSHTEKMMDAVSGAYELLYGQQGLDLIAKAISRIEDISEYDAGVINPLVEQLQAAYYQLEDAAFGLRSYRDSLEFNPGRLLEVEDRLNELFSLRRKYGDSIETIMDYYHNIRKETETLENKDELLQELEGKRAIVLERLLKEGEALSEARKACAGELAEQIENELRDLQMERTSIKVEFNVMTDPSGVEWKGRHIRLGKQGLDTAEFLISPNPGEPLRPLGKIASGGELSRIMLALKTIFARHDHVPVLVFDEVDTGVSGRAAQSIAEKLYKLSDSCQVFSITHLPQVACMADNQYLIEKKVADGRTMTLVQTLDQKGRVMELARMLGGVEITEKTLHHAQEMLSLAQAKRA